jgi:hypothetical protein
MTSSNNAMAERYSPPMMRNSGFFVMVDNASALGGANGFVKVKLTVKSRELGLFAARRAAIWRMRNSSAA